MILALALSLGFFGSLHCLGMCGPLVLGIIQPQSLDNQLLELLKYNISRSLAYGFLGIGIGLIGNLYAIGNIQHILSLLGGVVLILLFLSSMDIENALFKIPGFRNLYKKTYQKIANHLLSRKKPSNYLLGFLNGILPCGLVYLALVGSLMTENIWQGGLFMLLFGLATIPVMIALVMGQHMLSVTWKWRISKILPLLQLCIGLLLLYRGIFVDVPTELKFLYLIQNPVLCH